jgi:hypothetical protein
METQTGVPCGTGAPSYLERVRYFPGQLMTPEDMVQEQNFQRARMRRHNRMLHGWGVVCGAWVTPKQTGEGTHPSVVTVEPGYLLGPYGDEIVIDQPVEVDVLTEDLDGNAVPCGGVADPWCANVRPGRQEGQERYLAVKYAECQTRPVRAYPDGCGCGCGGSDCEYSRIRDSFVMKVLTMLPKSHDPLVGTQGQFGGVLWCATQEERPARQDCLPCPPDPWLVLATIRMQDSASIGEIDPTVHRRFAAAFGAYYYACSPQGEPTVSRSTAAGEAQPGRAQPAPPGAATAAAAAFAAARSAATRPPPGAAG